MKILNKNILCLFIVFFIIFTIWGKTIGYDQDLIQAYNYAFSKGITTKTDINDANLMGNLTRAHMAKMLSNRAEKTLDKKVNTSNLCLFDDIGSQSNELKGYIKKSCQMGLMGIGIKSFFPEEVVTRAQFGTTLSRAIRGTKNNGGIPYFLNHIKNLKEEGIMNNINQADNIEKRGYVMLMLQRADPNYTTQENINSDYKESIEEKNIVYDTQNNLTLDIKIPGSKSPVPIYVIYTINPDRDLLQADLYDEIYKNGYGIVKVTLRYGNNYTFPTSIVDAKSAIRFLKENSKKYNIDQNNIAVGGTSKNGMFAQMVGVSSDIQEFEIGENLNQNSKIQAVINFAGHTDLSIEIINNNITQHGAQYLGCSYNCSNIATKASAISYISPDDAPTLLFLGTEDKLVPISQMTNFKEELDNENIENTFYNINGAGHNVEYQLSTEYINKIIIFLDKHLK